MRAHVSGMAMVALMSVADAQTPLGATPCAPPVAWQQAQNNPSPEKDATGSGSGSTGMAPQQGTGSGSTQSPGANQAETGATPAPSPLNRDYGRETAPSGQEMHQSNPDKAKSPN